MLSSSNLKITIKVESPDKLSDNQNFSIWSRKSKIPIELNIDWRNRVGGVVTMIEHQLAKMCSTKISSSKISYWQRIEHSFFRAADPVNRQKIYLFVIEASSKLWKFFATYYQLACRHYNCKTDPCVSSLLLAVSHGGLSLTVTDTRHSLISVVTSVVSTLKYTLRVT